MMQAVRIFALLLATAAGSAVAAQGTPPSGKPLTLRVQHELSSLGSDGVRRDVFFTERVYREGDAVWIERELPKQDHADLADRTGHDEADHAKAGQKAPGGHKHMDTSTAPRWIERQPSGKLSVRLVSDTMQRTLAVSPAEYGNIGFDGSWATAYHLLDPAALKTMKATGAPRGGVQAYQARRGNEQVTVQWDVAGQFPRLVQSRNGSGTVRKVTRVTAVASPPAAPWRRIQGYAQGEYTDLLD
jgi:hypothetical protein